MLSIYYKALRMTELETRDRFEKGVLIEAVSPTDEEIKKLVDELHIEADLIHDALDPNEAPRLEMDEGVAYLFVRYPLLDDEQITTIPFLLAIGPDFVLLVSHKETPLVHYISHPGANAHTTQKTKLVLQILKLTNQAYHNHLLALSRHMKAVQVNVKRENIENKDIIHLIEIEEIFNDLINSLVPNSAALNKFLSGKVLPLFEEDKDLLEDLILDTNELADLAKARLRSTINTRDAYSTILTNNLNRVIRLLTSITIILTIAVIIPGLYGMNVPLPYQDSPYAFFEISGAIVLVSAGLAYLFSRNKWL
jgi:magnesium transporter